MENMRKNTYIGARTKLSLLPEFAKKTSAHATRKRVTGARESSLSSIQWSFQNGSSG
jgi:hypothetical protein